MNALEYVVSLKDKVSSRLDAIARSFRATNTAARGLTGSIDSLRAQADGLRLMRNASTDLSAIQSLNTQIRNLESEASRLQNLPPPTMGERFREMANGILPQFAAALFAAFSIGAIAMLGTEVIKLTAEFEKYNAVLTNTFGSSQMAGQAMQGLEEFASKTPFQLNEITGAYIKMVNRGLIPTKKELTSFGDIASSQGKSIDQFTEAILDAQTGEMERLKEFGFTAEKHGKKVAMTFKGQTQTIDLTAESMRKYFDTVGQMKGVSGSMAAISETLEGKLSNLSDAADSLKRAIGAGLSPYIKVVVSGLTSMAAWAQRNLDVLVPIAGVFLAVGASLAVYSVGLMIAKKAQDGMTRAIIAQNLALLASPITWVVLGVVALAAAFVIAYKRSETFRGVIWAISGAFKAAYTGFKEFATGVWEGIKNIASGVWQILSTVLAPIINYYKMMGGAFLWVVSKVWEGIKYVASGISSVFGTVYSYLSGFFTKIAQVAQTVFSGIFQPLIEGVKSAFSWIVDNVLKPMAAFGGSLLDKMGIDIKGLTEGFSKITTGGKQIGAATGDYAEKIAKGTKDGFAEGVKGFRAEKAAKNQNAGGFLDNVANSTLGMTGKGAGGDSDKKANKAGETVASGGTKHTNITINLGNLVETINLHGIDKNDLTEMDEAVLNSLTRVLAMAQGNNQ